ncbi:MAG: hypothetical protein H7069_09750 [Phormidesmis sp. FL-bin-119]|nr:hypothetical protein [Pedobacter sp.]
MARSKFNVLTHGLSGLVGDMIVFRQRANKTIVCGKPRPTTKSAYSDCPPSATRYHIEGSDQLDFSWWVCRQCNSNKSDELMAMIFCPATEGFWCEQTLGITRADGFCTIDVPYDLRGSEVHVWLRYEIPGTSDVFGLYFPEKGGIAHVGFIDEWKDPWVITVEGNTNVLGSREGDGVYRKRRLIRTVDKVARYVN